MTETESEISDVCKEKNIHFSLSPKLHCKVFKHLLASSSFHINRQIAHRDCLIFLMMVGLCLYLYFFLFVCNLVKWSQVKWSDTCIMVAVITLMLCDWNVSYCLTAKCILWIYIESILMCWYHPWFIKWLSMRSRIQRADITLVFKWKKSSFKFNTDLFIKGW